MLGISGDGGECYRGSVEQQIVNHRLVLIGEFANGCGEGEDDVIVLDGQEVAAAVFEPAFSGPTLTLGAVAVTARVVGNLGVLATLTTRNVPAERGGAAALDG